MTQGNDSSRPVAATATANTAPQTALLQRSSGVEPTELDRAPVLHGDPIDDLLEDEPAAVLPPQVQKLRMQQQQALQALSEGRPVQAAARAAGVDRRTVSRWLRSDERFVAALAAWRQRIHTLGKARLLSMTRMALDTVEGAIVNDNLAVSMAVLKGTSVLSARQGEPAPRPKIAAARRAILEDVREQWPREVTDPAPQILEMIGQAIDHRLLEVFQEKA